MQSGSKGCNNHQVWTSFLFFFISPHFPSFSLIFLNFPSFSLIFPHFSHLSHFSVACWILGYSGYGYFQGLRTGLHFPAAFIHLPSSPSLSPSDARRTINAMQCKISGSEGARAPAEQSRTCHWAHNSTVRQRDPLMPQRALVGPCHPFDAVDSLLIRWRSEDGHSSQTSPAKTCASPAMRPSTSRNAPSGL